MADDKSKATEIFMIAIHSRVSCVVFFVREGAFHERVVNLSTYVVIFILSCRGSSIREPLKHERKMWTRTEVLDRKYAFPDYP
jgi:hypothetical protein